ncbi:MAG: UPF0182 family protein, partial [Candidatus Nanopelagicales bacterium]
RNSVKATVDAYTGQVVLYAWDEQDPLLQTWMKAFPGTVQPRSAMSDELLAHVRYPEDIFKVQREIFAQYHVTDPGGFYSGQDFWTVPNDPTKPAASSAQPPYYLQVQMPGQSKPAFSLTTTFAPNKRQTLAAFMAANSEPGPEYGKLKVLQLPSNTTIPGPVQAQNNFESDPGISSQLSLLRRGGSDVVSGNLLSLPVAGGVLYIEPIYIRAAGNEGFPLLQKVMAGYGNKVAFRDTLAEALADVFGTGSGTVVNPDDNGNGNGNNGNNGNLSAEQRLTAALAAAQKAYDDGRAALAKGDFAAYGDAQVALEKALTEAAAAQKELTGGTTTDPSASPTPSTSSASSA